MFAPLSRPVCAVFPVQATVLWRQESGANDALATPHPRFDLIKKHYPTYFHGKVSSIVSPFSGRKLGTHYFTHASFLFL